MVLDEIKKKYTWLPFCKAQKGSELKTEVQTGDAKFTAIFGDYNTNTQAYSHSKCIFDYNENEQLLKDDDCN